MYKLKKKISIFVSLLIPMQLFLVGMPMENVSAGHSDPAFDHILICHRTGSDTHPYQEVYPDS